MIVKKSWFLSVRLPKKPSPTSCPFIVSDTANFGTWAMLNPDYAME
jgi:hypothetical protein